MERFAGRVAIVTGASAGIGAAICERLVKYGMSVIGCARNVAAIEALSQTLKGDKGKLIAVQCDVAREDQVKAMFARIQKEYGRVDVCINNAGVGHNAPLLSGKTEQWRQMLEVNVLGAAIVTREAVQCMRNNKIDGHVINLNSMSGHRLVGSDSINFYAATKFALTAMTEGLRTELRQINSLIRVSQISPAVVASDFLTRLNKWTDAEVQEKLMGQPHLQVSDIVDAVIYQMSAPPSVQIHDILMRPTTGVK